MDNAPTEAKAQRRLSARHPATRALWGVLALAVATPAWSAKLVGVVSERSAPAAAAGAEAFLAEHADHNLELRTPEQLAELTDRAVLELWQDADALLIGAVFGDSAPRLARLLRQEPPPQGTPVLAVASDQRLVRLSRFDGEQPLAGLAAKTMDALTADPGADQDPMAFMDQLAADHPAQAPWIRGRAYWQGRGSANLAGLYAWLLKRSGVAIDAPEPKPAAPLRYYRHGEVTAAAGLDLPAERPAVAIVDYDTGDQAGRRQLLDALCQAIENQGPACFAILARWGPASRQAVQRLDETVQPTRLGAVISLQDFVVGGGEGREAVTEALKELDVPVLKGIRLTDRTRTEWQLSEDGLPYDSIHYRVAMPELQGISQPLVLAAAEPAHTDPRTGLRFATTQPVASEVQAMAERTAHWLTLQEKANADKRIAIVYYNHPPGRHNIGADNLDVPKSLYRILHALKDAGYQTGKLPDSPQALLDRMQTRGVNLPENRQELERMSQVVQTMAPKTYRDWFGTLPQALQEEMVNGPLGYLVTTLRAAVEAGKPQLGRDLLSRMTGDLRHLLEGSQAAAAPRALDLLEQLNSELERLLNGDGSWQKAHELARAIRETGIEGLSGWGEPPGYTMVHNNQILLPGMRFGNIWVGPQPPRGWELDEELLHSNLAFPPPHQYLAYYHWLQDGFGADALVHLGRHSTYEFLPRRRVGLTKTDYSRLIGGDLPGVYPYIVDGVGEGLQAKRRGLAVMVDHLTPPLSTTPLYDELLKLRQLVESYESAAGQGQTPARRRALADIRGKVKELDLTAEIEQELQEERGQELRLEQIDGDLLVHEVGHYLTTLQEEFMPRGLHIFGKPWSAQARQMTLASMAGDGDIQPAWRQALEASPEREMQALLAGLDGEFIPPAKGNDPIRSPEVLPPGRNFHGLNGNLLPTRVGWELGAQMAADARSQSPRPPQGSEAVVLWASDTVRDEGAMVAFGMDMLGIKPVWNSRGIVKGLERQSLGDGRYRRDVVFTTSGLFRDLYGNLNAWLDKAVRLALDGASQTIREQHPALAPALEAALAPLGELRNAGTESLKHNQVAAHWLADVQQAVESGQPPAKAGQKAIFRVYGDAPGGYGAGVNRLTERSGAWQKRGELADAYIHRMGHAYGADAHGKALHNDFRSNLQRIERTYLGRASNLYGLLDNNDAFDYMGGLSMAVEQVAGQTPVNRIVDHSDPDNAQMQPLRQALLQELRGQFLNPAWLKGQMQHGYSGARTMGAKFFEHLWGWQVTNPQIIQDWVWREVKSVYLDDRHDLGLDKFLSEGHRAHVKTNMLAIMNVAIQKGFWEAQPATAQSLAEQFARQVVEHGLPGSGHTRPNHPVFEFIQPKLDAQLHRQLNERLTAAQVKQSADAGANVTTVAELEPAEQQPSASAQSAQPGGHQTQSASTQSQSANASDAGNSSQKGTQSNNRSGSNRQADIPWFLWALGIGGVILLGGGFWAGQRSGGKHV